MKIYLVGGAVRDRLLGIEATERDWVVVGSDPETMISKGFRPVGKDFPVFLHPETGEEYALARTERKSGRGYHGFSFHTGPDVSLEDDLWRRDLTINAMAQDEQGQIIDPHDGQADIASKTLRHVSGAFVEDPVRILRVARFAARFADRGFSIAEETMALMKQMVSQGEVDHLVAERVWKETERALMEARPAVFFSSLHASGALQRIMPEIAALDGVPQRADYHPEVDTFIHILMCLEAAQRAGHPIEVRISALLHDLGKALTPESELPSHRGHEETGIPLVREFCQRMRVPNAARDLALKVTREHLKVHRARELRPSKLLELLENFSAFRQPDQFELALASCECDARGRLGFENCAYPQTDYLRAAAKAAEVSNESVLKDGFKGADISAEIRRRRSEKLTAWKNAQRADQDVRT